MDAVALGRGIALLASAAIHAGLIVAAGFVPGHSRTAGEGAAPRSQLVFVHLPSRPAADIRSEAPPVTGARLARPAARGNDEARMASIPGIAVESEGAQSSTPESGAAREAPALPAVALAREASVAARVENRGAAGTQTSAIETAAADYLVAPEPEYPPRAREEGQEGLVILRVRVSRLGMPAEIRVATSSGYRLLDRAAEQAVARWSFRPARRGDDAVEAWMVVPIRFRLQQG